MSASKPCTFMLNSFSVSLIAPTPYKYSLSISKMPSIVQQEVMVVNQTVVPPQGHRRWKLLSVLRSNAGSVISAVWPRKVIPSQVLIFLCEKWL